MADSINTINVGGIDKEVEDTVARTSGSNANSRCTTLESSVSNLAARVEEIIAPTGEAPNPAEVVDARIGADGVIYNTLGDAIRNNDIKADKRIDAVEECEMDGLRHVGLWTNGSWRHTSGVVTLTSNNKRIRENSFLFVKTGDIVNISNGESYVHAVGIYRGTPSNAVTIRNDKTFIASDETIHITRDCFVIVIFADATDQTTVLNPDNFTGDVTISSYSMRKFKNDIAPVNSVKVSPHLKDASGINSGVEYSIVNEIATLEGTATDAALIVLWDTSSEDVPDWIEENTDYYVEINKSNPEDPLRFRISTYDKNGNWIEYIYNSKVDHMFHIGSLDNIGGIKMWYYVPGGQSTSCTANVQILSCPSNKKLASLVGTNGNPVKIRLMQNNLGRLNMGKALDSGVHFLTTDNYDTILANYKKMYSEYQPDVIGFEEFEYSRDIYTTDTPETVYRTANIRQELFNRVYPNIYSDTSISSKNAIASKYPILDSANVSIPYSYEYDGVQYSATARVRLSHVHIGGKTLAIISTPMVSSSSTAPDAAQYVEARKAFYPLVFEMLDDEQYAFVICDANHSGVKTPEKTYMECTSEEGESLYNTVIKPAGFETVMGSYYPWEPTYISFNDPNRIGTIDNIYYRNNGKIILCGMKALDDYYNPQENKLASDHVPIIADFVLL